MSTKVFANPNNDSVIISVDTLDVQNEAIASVSLQGVQYVEPPNTELALAQQRLPSSQTFTIDANAQNVKLISSDLSNLQISSTPIRIDGAIATSTPVEVIQLPSSYVIDEDIGKWERLCWEQQKSEYGPLEWWQNFFYLKSDTLSAGYVPNEMEFPVWDPAGGEPPVDSFVKSLIGKNYKQIHTTKSNPTIEGIQTLWRTQTEHQPWKMLRETDSEDDPEEWWIPGAYEISTYATIDSKQVPLPPSNPGAFAGYSGFRQEPAKFELNQDFDTRPKITSYWGRENGIDQLWVHYNNTILSITEELRFYKDDELIHIEDLTTPKDTPEALVGTFDDDSLKPLPFTVTVDMINKSRVRTRKPASWIADQQFRTQMPMVAETSTIIQSIEPPDGAKDYFTIYMNIDRDKLFLPENEQTGWDVNINQDSNYFLGIHTRKIVSRLVVAKRFSGIEQYLGAFIINPIRRVDDSTTVTNLDGVFEYHNDDQTETQYVVRFYPTRGALQFSNTSEPSETEVQYDFRIAEWTLGIEYGLVTGKKYAYLLEDTSPRQRYDTWDEEHPVRIWKRMNPVDPTYDSVNRLSRLAKSRKTYTIYANTPVNSQIEEPTDTDDTIIINNMGWKTIYSKINNFDYFGTWPYFSLNFRLNNKYKNATSIRLTAKYFYIGNRLTQQEIDTIDNIERDVILQSEYARPGIVQIEAIGSTPYQQSLEFSGTLLARWSHWSDELHICDFTSYQYVFYLVWNYLLRSGKLQPPTTEITDPFTGATLTIQQGPDEYYLDAETMHQYETQCLEMAHFVDQWIKDNVFFTYTATIEYKNMAGNLIVESVPVRSGGQSGDNEFGHTMLSTTDSVLSSLIDAYYGPIGNPEYEPFGYELVPNNDPSQNDPFISVGFAYVAGQLRLGDYETAPTPGLVPAQKPVDINFDEIGVNDVDMSGTMEAEEI